MGMAWIRSIRSMISGVRQPGTAWAGTLLACAVVALTLVPSLAHAEPSIFDDDYKPPPPRPEAPPPPDPVTPAPPAPTRLKPPAAPPSAPPIAPPVAPPVSPPGMPRVPLQRTSIPAAAAIAAAAIAAAEKAVREV